MYGALFWSQALNWCFHKQLVGKTRPIRQVTFQTMTVGHHGTDHELVIYQVIFYSFVSMMNISL